MRPEFLLTLLVALAPAALAAATPPAVGDTPLPTLAPMIKKVSPAVVNIATRGTIRERGPQNPLFDDPFFRRSGTAARACYPRAARAAVPERRLGRDRRRQGRLRPHQCARRGECQRDHRDAPGRA